MSKKKMEAWDWLAIVLVTVGALNWGLVGLFNWNLVTALFNDVWSRVVYGLVGLAGLYSAGWLLKKLV